MKNSLLIILLLCLSSCMEIERKGFSPNRLKTIPKEAFWVGGPDGGNWYEIKSINAHRNMASIILYNDQTGEIILSKRFMMVCMQDNQHFIDDLEHQIDSFDGEKIILKNGCWLQ